MRLLSGIAVFTICCMFMVAVVTDRLADSYLFQGTGVPASRVHLINDVTIALKHAEASRRAYLATGDNSYLQAYRHDCTDVDEKMDRLVSDDHEVTNKLTHAADLREFMHMRLSEIGEAMASATPTRAPAEDSELIRIQKLLDSLTQEESNDISGELQAARERSAFHRNLVIALAAINLLFLGGVAFCAVQIGKLYSLVTMCAWSKRVQYQDKWVPLEEYMKKRFGIRISHGISQEEYDKWAVPEMADQPQDEQEPPHPAPKAAA